MQKMGEQKERIKLKTSTRIGYWALGFSALIIGVLFNDFNYSNVFISNNPELIIWFFFKCLFISVQSYLFYCCYFSVYKNFSNEDQPIKYENIDLNDCKKYLTIYSSTSLLITFILFLFYFILSLMDSSLISLSYIKDDLVRFIIVYVIYNLTFIIFGGIYYVLLQNIKINNNEPRSALFNIRYTFLLPTIMTIGYNVYFGLSMTSFFGINNTVGEPPLLSYIPIIALILYLLLLLIINVIRNKLGSGSKNYRKIYILDFSFWIIALVLFLWNVKDLNQKPYTYLIISIGISFFLGIFEGWHSLIKLKVGLTCLKSDKTIMNTEISNQYYFIMLLMIIYPITLYLYYFFVNQVNGLTGFFLFAFSILCFISIVRWIINGQSINISNPKLNIGRQKLLFGFFTILILMIDRISVIFNYSIINIPTFNLVSTDLINLTLGIITIAITFFSNNRTAFSFKPNTKTDAFSNGQAFWTIATRWEHDISTIEEYNINGNNARFFYLVFSAIAVILFLSGLIVGQYISVSRSMIISFTVFILALALRFYQGYLVFSYHKNTDIHFDSKKDATL